MTASTHQITISIEDVRKYECAVVVVFSFFLLSVIFVEVFVVLFWQCISFLDIEAWLINPFSKKQTLSV